MTGVEPGSFSRSSTDVPEPRTPTRLTHTPAPEPAILTSDFAKIELVHR
jgi:hypothetical protein